MNVNPYVKIVPTSELPMEIENEDTGELEIVNMFNIHYTLYVSLEVFDELMKKYGD